MTYARELSEIAAALTIDGSKNVGVNATSPVRKLDVRNTSADYQLHLGDTASTVLGYELGRENTGGLFKFYGNQTGATGYIFSGVDGERMRIDTAGNVGIGTSSAADSSSRLTVSGTSTVLLDASGSLLRFNKTAGTDTGWLSNRSYGWHDGNGLALSTQTADPLRFGTNSSERMRIDSSGNVGIGTSSPSGKLNIVGGSLASNSVGLSISTQLTTGRMGTYGANTCSAIHTYYDDSTVELSAGVSGSYYSGISVTALSGSSYGGTIRFATSGLERMRIDSSGNVNIGLTASGARLGVKSTTADSSTYPLVVVNSSSQNVLYARSDGYVAIEKAYSIWTTANAASVWMDSGGGLYRSTSSIKYKKNVVDTDKGLTDVLKLRAVLYEGKSDIDAGKQFGGLIAEEVAEAGLSEFVQYGEGGEPEGLNYGPMVSLAFKAIQEQQAMIEELKAKVAALEAA